MKTAIVNLGDIVSGDWRDPHSQGDIIVTDGGRIVSVGTASAAAVESADVVIDAAGMTAIPGLIDSHVHITFGDYTPRQRTVGFLESYLHGGVTTAISASEVHVPGRPRDVEGVKALAGVPRFVGRSRNTPATMRKARVDRSSVMQDFTAPAH